MTSYKLSITTDQNDYDFDYNDDFEAISELKDYIRDGIEADDGFMETVISAAIVESITSGGMIVSEDTIYKYDIVTTYAPDTQITFILAETIDGDKGTTEVKGFYYGGEDISITVAHIGKLSAEYTDLRIKD